MSTARVPRPRRGRQTNYLRRFRPSRLLPYETRVHLNNAGREELLAIRSLLDAAIARLESRERSRP